MLNHSSNDINTFISFLSDNENIDTHLLAPRCRNLLAKNLPLEEIDRLGQKLKSLRIKTDSFTILRIAVLSNFTSHVIENYLSPLLLSNNIKLEFYHSEYNQMYIN